MIEHQHNISTNKLASKLIDEGKDNFDITASIELHDLIERIKRKRCIDTRAARKIAIHLLKVA